MSQAEIGTSNCQHPDLAALKVAWGRRRKQKTRSLEVNFSFGVMSVRLEGLRSVYGRVGFGLSQAELRASCNSCLIPMESREPKNTFSMSIEKQRSVDMTAKSDRGDEVSLAIGAEVSPTSVKPIAHASATDRASEQREERRSERYRETDWQVQASGSETQSRWLFKPRGNAAVLIGSVSEWEMARVEPLARPFSVAFELTAFRKHWRMVESHLQHLSTLREKLLTAYVLKVLAAGPLCTARLNDE